LFLVFAVLLVGSISASFEVGNLSHSIEKKYGPGANILGWINISLKDEPINSVFTDSLGNSTTLQNLLDLNSVKPDCFPKDCLPGYLAKEPVTTKTFDLYLGTPKIIGLKLQGDITKINSIKFKISSDAEASCTNQLGIDFFADGVIDFMNNKSASGTCSKNYGCFDDSEITYSYKVLNDKYCQKVNLSSSPKYIIGAWIKKVSGSRNFTMELYSIDEYNNTNFEGNCKIDGTSILTTGQEVSCEIDYSSLKYQEAFVCIYSHSGIGDYYIKGYQDDKGCGYFGGTGSPDNLNVAYKLFAQGKKFASFGNLDITNNFGNGERFTFLAEEYLIEKYGDLNCGNEGCVIPIKIDSGSITESQKVTLSDLSLEYISSGTLDENNFYELTESPAKVGFDFQKLWLDDSGLVAPTDYGKYNYILKLGNKNITEEIEVKKVPIIQRLFPTMTVSAYPTRFEVKLDSYDNVSKYEWDFDNGDFATTENNKVTYTYNKTGFYDLKITITTDDDFSTYKVFNLTIGPPEEVINSTLKKYKKNLESLKENFKDYSSFTLQSLKEIFNLEEIETTIEQLEADFEIAETEEEFNFILSELLKIDIPKSVSTTSESTSLTYYPQKENVNLYLIEEITGEESSESEEDLVNAIFVWNQKNLITKIGFTEISATYSDSEEQILTTFILNIDEKENFNGKAYLIFDGLENLNFDKYYSQEEKADYVYIDLKNVGKNIVFSTTEDVSFSDLPVFIAPEFNLLDLQISAKCGDGICDLSETKESCPKDCKKEIDYTIYILIVVFLILLAIIVYVFMQVWYRKKYETYLFKNKNDLFNIMHYVNSSKKKGLSESEIEKSLRKSKWGNEQVNYAMKKYSGKRTGMVEIPIDKLIKKISLKKSQKDLHPEEKY